MPRITLDLPETVFADLHALADQEDRDTRGQAVYLIRRALGRPCGGVGPSEALAAASPPSAAIFSSDVVS